MGRPCGLQIRRVLARAGTPTSGRAGRFRRENERRLAGPGPEPAAVLARCYPFQSATHDVVAVRADSEQAAALLPLPGRNPCRGPLHRRTP